NLMMLFTEAPLLERPAAAAASGFRAVETWWPFAGPRPADGDVETFASRLDEAGTGLVCCNFYGGAAAGDRGVLSLPEEQEAAWASIETVAAIAELTGCRTFHALYGNRLEGVPPGQQDDLAAANMALASAALAPFDGTLVLEVLNPFDSPSYPLISLDAALAARRRAEEAGATNIALLIDLYHFGRLGTAPSDVLRRAGELGAIGHVQIADPPGRGEPGTGELGVEGLIGPLVAAGWDGWVGLEYRPSTTTEASLVWLAGDDLARLPAG
ncbi:MAG TPA: TIM barrel protein, partial [Acidimicrobiales bacterium]|nr:TIM barrel protein [Acidimicrobiales bacterium]